MNDLTRGSLLRHLLSMAAFIAVGLAFQAAYFLIDLYFVAGLGPVAIAGVGAAGNTSFLVMAASQLIGVGVTSMVARAMGAKDRDGAALVFNQSAAMAAVAFVATLLGGALAAGPMIHAIAADPATADAGTRYLYAFLPSLAAMFPTTALTAALRGAGIVRPTMLVQTGSLALNAVLAPVLIVGWLTHYPLGVVGAGLSSTIAALVGLAVLSVVFERMDSGLSLTRSLLRPRFGLWLRIVAIGLPVAGEFAMMFVITSILYWVIRDFGAAAQAGYGIGARIMTSIFLPAMAVAFALTPVAGQNLGAGLADRVRATLRHAILLTSGLMVTLSLLCHWRPEALIGLFTRDPDVTAVAAEYLAILSWNFVGTGIVFVCSGMFQALGNTLPSFIGSASRLVTWALPAILLAGHPGIRLVDFWYLSIGSVVVQAILSLILLRRSLAGRLAALPVTDRAVAVPAVA